MKLSTLYEARDPKKEAELEPYLAAPFRSYRQRVQIGRKTGIAYRQEYGMPERQFLPEPPKDNQGHGYRHDSSILHTGPWHTDIGTAKNIPILRYRPGDIKPDPNKVETGVQLNKAIGYWSKNFNGERWPALEQAFLNRDWTFKGNLGLGDSARTSLFKYLNELKTSWPEGQTMADRVLTSKNAIIYVLRSPEVRKYITKRPPTPELIKQIKLELTQHEAQMANYTERYSKWLVAQKPIDDFHADDHFGPNLEPVPPTWAYGDINWAQQYTGVR
jgi:hypothetical protein